MMSQVMMHAVVKGVVKKLFLAAITAVAVNTLVIKFGIASVSERFAYSRMGVCKRISDGATHWVTGRDGGEGFE
jgi:hypothetical protein